MTTLLIDADILVYRSIASVETEVEWEQDVWVMSTDLKDAHEAFHEMLRAILTVSPTPDYQMCFSDKGNFRKEINPTYKGNRVGVRKPMGFKPFREQIVEKYGSITKPMLEADDVIGILATKPGSDFIISSADKDLRTIPGAHLVNGLVENISEREADMNFFTQVLTGDTADGYPGCPGVGPKGAEKILSASDARDDPWSFIVSAYTKAKLTEQDALLQARMARILRWRDWDSDNQKVILWTPTN